jgi:hypothetical protein
MPMPAVSTIAAVPAMRIARWWLAIITGDH